MSANQTQGNFSRRDFIKTAGVITVSATLAACAPGSPEKEIIRVIDEGPQSNGGDLANIDNFIEKISPDTPSTITPFDIAVIEIDRKFSSLINRPLGENISIPVSTNPETGGVIQVGDMTVDPNTAQNIITKTIDLDATNSQLFLELMSDPKVGVAIPSSKLIMPVNINVNGQNLKIGPGGDISGSVKMVESRSATGSYWTAVVYDSNGKPIVVTNQIGKGHLPIDYRQPNNHYSARHSLELELANNHLGGLNTDLVPLIRDLPTVSETHFNTLLKGDRVLSNNLLLEPIVAFKRKNYTLQVVNVRQIDGTPLTSLVMTQSFFDGQPFHYGWAPSIFDNALGYQRDGLSQLDAFKFIAEQAAKKEIEGKPISLKVFGYDGEVTNSQDILKTLRKLRDIDFPNIPPRLYHILRFGTKGVMLAAPDVIDTIRLGLVLRIMRDTPNSNLFSSIGESIGIQVSESIGNPQMGSVSFEVEEALSKHKDGNISLVYQAKDGAAFSTQLLIPHLFVVEKVGPESENFVPVVTLIDNIPANYSVDSYSLIKGSETPLFNIDDNEQIPVSESDSYQLDENTFSSLCQNLALGNFSINDIPEGLNINHRVYYEDENPESKRFHIYSTVQRIPTAQGYKHVVFSHYFEDNRIIT